MYMTLTNILTFFKVGFNLRNNKRLLTVGFLLMVISIIGTKTAHGSISEADSLALVALYNSTNGDEWIDNTGWLEAPVESWFGIDRTDDVEDGMIVITRIDLRENNLTGELPADFGNMIYLERLNLSGNFITGEIPTEMGDMTYLERLDLGDNQLNGSIPPSLGNLEFLERLDLSETLITGEIPIEMYNLERLERLDLNNLEITGTISPQITGLTNLERLDLSSTALEGDIPPELSQLQWLERLDLGSNDFTNGIIPVEIMNIQYLEQLYLNNTNRTGEIPDGLGNLQFIVNIDLGENNFEGQIPDLSNLQHLESLRLSNNSLNGEIPVWIGDFESLESLGLNGNQLNGSIPEELGSLLELNTLSLNDNDLSGGIPSDLGNLILLDSLNLANNQLSGDLSAELSGMGSGDDDSETTTMEVFIVSGNTGLTGDIPMEFTNWDPDVMRVFWFDGTGLTEPQEDAFQDWLDAILEPGPDDDETTYRSVKRADDEPTSSDQDLVNNLPNEIQLHQNYPNPFNPVTTIRYELSSNVHVNLSVYNVLGQKVSELVNEQKGSGYYEINFNASRLSSGTYVYRLEAGDRVLTHSMLLIK